MIHAEVCVNTESVVHEGVELSLDIQGQRVTRLDIHYPSVLRYCGRHIPLAAQDALLWATAVYALDAAIPRTVAAGGWTREFVVTVPVWERQFLTAAPALNHWLRLVTGDRWHFVFVQDSQRLSRPLIRPGRPWPGGKHRIDAIGLYGDDLDSVLGIIEWLETHTGRLLVVGHRGSDAPRVLRRHRCLLEQLCRAYPGRLDLMLVPIRLDDGLDVPPASQHGTTGLDSRPVLLLALAVQAFACRMMPGEVILKPECGRESPWTSHPLCMALLDRCLASLPALIVQPHGVINPLLGMTTAEAIHECRNPTLVQHLVPPRNHTIEASVGVRRARGMHRHASPQVQMQHGVGRPDRSGGRPIAAAPVHSPAMIPV